MLSLGAQDRWDPQESEPTTLPGQSIRGRRKPLPQHATSLLWARLPAAVPSHCQATAGSGSVVLGSAKTHTSNFHTICKRLIRKAFLFNIKQVRKKCPQLISAVPDFHWDVAATGAQLRGGLSRISQMAERRAIHQPTEISHAIWFKY